MCVCVCVCVCVTVILGNTSYGDSEGTFGGVMVCKLD